MLKPHMFFKRCKGKMYKFYVEANTKGHQKRDKQRFSATCGNINFKKLTDKYMNNLSSIPSRGGVEWGLTGVLSGHVKRVAVGTSLSS